MIILVCALITLCVLVYIFYLPGSLYVGPEKTRLVYLRERKEVVYENLRDLNFEYKAGKFPDSDYRRDENDLWKRKPRLFWPRLPTSKGYNSATSADTREEREFEVPSPCHPERRRSLSERRIEASTTPANRAPARLQ